MNELQIKWVPTSTLWPNAPPGFVAFLADENSRPAAVNSYVLPPVTAGDGSDSGKMLVQGTNGLTYSPNWRMEYTSGGLINDYDAGEQVWAFEDDLIVLDAKIRWHVIEEGVRYDMSRQFSLNQGGLSIGQGFQQPGHPNYIPPNQIGSSGNLLIGRNLVQGQYTQQGVMLGTDCSQITFDYGVVMIGEGLTTPTDGQGLDYLFMFGRNKQAATSRRMYFAVDNGVWLKPRAVDPPTPEAGVFSYDSRYGRLIVHNGTQMLTSNADKHANFSANFTFAIGDANSSRTHPSADTAARTATIPANASVPFPLGTRFRISNQNGAGVVTIAITSDTLRLAGTATTGSRTLAANGYIDIWKIADTEWMCDGKGVT